MRALPRRSRTTARSDAVAPVERSALAWRFMAYWFARFLRRHLNAVWIARWSEPSSDEHAGPLVIYCNHPAWWDAATVIVLADRLTPRHAGFAPFDARMLTRYRIFRKLGAFGVDLDTARGGAQFLATARSLLADPRHALWITAQGRFSDVRERPLGLKPGVARLPELAPDAVFVPLALEYAFWDERGAEAFCAFGPAMLGSELVGMPRSARLQHLEAALTATMDRLADDVIARDPTRFEPLLSGAKGVGGIYDVIRRARAMLGGRRFDPAHNAPVERTPR